MTIEIGMKGEVQSFVEKEDTAAEAETEGFNHYADFHMEYTSKK